MSDGTVNNFVYGYDQRNRLISVKQNNTTVESYNYDANGNRLTQTNSLRYIQNQTSTYNLGDQIISDGQSSFEYDGDGRLSKKTNGDLIEEYNYSSEGKLLSVIFKEDDLTTKTIGYQHNALGNRVAKLINGVITEKYLWLNKTTLLATYDKDDNLKQRYEYGLSHTPVSFTQNNTKYYITSDHLGSPRVIVDEAGLIIKLLDYDSFGNVIADSNAAFEIPFGFAGGLKDGDTGLLRFGYRDYDAKTGRWTARDPIGFAGGDTNLYGYVANDPLNWIDPTGENALGLAIGFIAVGYIGSSLKTCSSGVGGYEESQELGDTYQDARDKLLACISAGCSNAEMQRLNENRQSSLEQGVDKLRDAAWDLATSTPSTTVSGSIPTSSADVIVGGVIGEAASE